MKNGNKIESKNIYNQVSCTSTTGFVKKGILNSSLQLALHRTKRFPESGWIKC